MNEFVAAIIFLGLCGSFALFITFFIFTGINPWIAALVSFIVFEVLFFIALKTVYPPSDKEKRHD